MEAKTGEDMKRLFLALVLGVLTAGLWLYLRETKNEKIARWAREQSGPSLRKFRQEGGCFYG